MVFRFADAGDSGAVQLFVHSKVRTSVCWLILIQIGGFW
jgi:hypothetical protein